MMSHSYLLCSQINRFIISSADHVQSTNVYVYLEMVYGVWGMVIFHRQILFYSKLICVGKDNKKHHITIR